MSRGGDEGTEVLVVEKAAALLMSYSASVHE
jgi:hypothetical protein